MTKQQAISVFEATWRGDPTDKVALRCAFNDFCDVLEKDGSITRRQADTWLNPYDDSNKRRRRRR